MGSGLDPDTLELMLEAISEFAARELPDARLIELDEADEFPEQTVRHMCSEDLGVQLVFVDEDYDGMGGGAFDVYRVCAHLAGIDLGVATAVLATALGSDPITVGGTPEQKKRWLTRIADDGALFAYGATEPQAGSDLAAMKTVAVPVVTDDAVSGYRTSRPSASGRLIGVGSTTSSQKRTPLWGGPAANAACAGPAWSGATTVMSSTTKWWPLGSR